MLYSCNPIISFFSLFIWFIIWIYFISSRINLFPTIYFIHLGLLLYKCLSAPFSNFNTCTSYLVYLYLPQQENTLLDLHRSYSFMEKLSYSIIRVHVYVVMELLHIVFFLTSCISSGLLMRYCGGNEENLMRWLLKIHTAILKVLYMSIPHLRHVLSYPYI